MIPSQSLYNAPNQLAQNPATQVEARLDRLRTELGNVDNAIQVLSDRLHRIVVPRGTGPSGEKVNAPRPVLCPLAEDLEGLIAQVNDQSERLVMLTAGLEL